MHANTSHTVYNTHPVPCKDEDLGFLGWWADFLSRVAGLGGRSGLDRPDIAPVLLWQTQVNDIGLLSWFQFLVYVKS